MRKCFWRGHLDPSNDKGLKIPILKQINFFWWYVLIENCTFAILKKKKKMLHSEIFCNQLHWVIHFNRQWQKNEKIKNSNYSLTVEDSNLLNCLKKRKKRWVMWFIQWFSDSLCMWFHFNPYILDSWVSFLFICLVNSIKTRQNLSGCCR